MTYAQASKQLRKIGTAHATGPSLAAMYGDLVSFQHAVSPDMVFQVLAKLPDDKSISETGREFIRDSDALLKALFP